MKTTLDIIFELPEYRRKQLAILLMQSTLNQNTLEEQSQIVDRLKIDVEIERDKK